MPPTVNHKDPNRDEENDQDLAPEKALAILMLLGGGCVFFFFGLVGLDVLSIVFGLFTNMHGRDMEGIDCWMQMLGALLCVIVSFKISLALYRHGRKTRFKELIGSVGMVLNGWAIFCMLFLLIWHFINSRSR